MDDIYSRAKRIPFPWDEAAPNNFVAWLEKFSRARNAVKEFVIWPLLSAISALISHTTKVKASSLYPEPVNIYTLFLAESGSNKLTAFSLAVDPIIKYVEEKQETIIVIEDSSCSGLYDILSRQAVRVFWQKMKPMLFFKRFWRAMAEIMERNWTVQFFASFMTESRG